MRKTKISQRCLAIAFSAIPLAVSAAPVVTEHLSIELVAETSTFAPGQDLWLGLHIRHQPHWHTYWINPGDSGLAMKLTWHLPPGFEAGEIQWPAPQRFVVDGLNNFGYDGDVLLPVKLHVATPAKAGDIGELRVDAKWLVCSEECVPGKATLKLVLQTVSGQPQVNAANTELFHAARLAQPQSAAWTGTATLRGETVEVALHGDPLPDVKSLDIFALQHEVVGYARPGILRRGDDLVLRLPKSDYYSSAPANLDLVLVTAPGRAWQMKIPFAAAQP